MLAYESVLYGFIHLRLTIHEVDLLTHHAQPTQVGQLLGAVAGSYAATMAIPSHWQG